MPYLIADDSEEEWDTISCNCNGYSTMLFPYNRLVLPWCFFLCDECALFLIPAEPMTRSEAVTNLTDTLNSANSAHVA